jgi:hypothetical protein
MRTEVKMSWEWFAVKSLLRSEAIGKPRTTKYPYDPKLTMVEERIVIFRARNEREAIKKAEREARRNLCRRAKNMFGETITHRLIRSFDVYPLDCVPSDGAEVFYLWRAVSKDVPDKRVAQKFIGEGPTPRKLQEKGFKFFACKQTAKAIDHMFSYVKPIRSKKRHG